MAEQLAQTDNDTTFLEDMFRSRDGMRELFETRAIDSGWTLEVTATPDRMPKTTKGKTANKSLLTIWIHFEHHSDLKEVVVFAGEIRDYMLAFHCQEFAPMTFLSPEPDKTMDTDPPLSGYSLLYLFQPQINN